MIDLDKFASDWLPPKGVSRWGGQTREVVDELSKARSEIEMTGYLRKLLDRVTDREIRHAELGVGADVESCPVYEGRPCTCGADQLMDELLDAVT
jgi:hypothetical protein